MKVGILSAHEQKARLDINNMMHSCFSYRQIFSYLSDGKYNHLAVFFKADKLSSAMKESQDIYE